MVSVMADGWCGKKKDVGETGGIWWKDKGEVSVSEVNIAEIYGNIEIIV